VLGNAGMIVSFRVGVEDAPYLAREFQPKFQVLHLVQLPKSPHLSQTHDRWNTFSAI